MVRTVGEDEEGGEASHSIVTPEHLHSCTLTLLVHRCGCCKNTMTQLHTYIGGTQMRLL